MNPLKRMSIENSSRCHCVINGSRHDVSNLYDNRVHLKYYKDTLLDNDEGKGMGWAETSIVGTPSPSKTCPSGS